MGLIREEGCTCSTVYLNSGIDREPVSFNWSADCPVYGVGSLWWAQTGKAQHEATRKRSVDLYRQAREAKKKFQQQNET